MASVTKTEAEQFETITEAAYAKSVDDSERGGVQRKPFLLTTQRSFAGGAKHGIEKGEADYILFYINPTQATWTFRRRVSIQQLRHYSVVHYQNRGIGSNATLYEEPTLTLEFTTGSLIRVVRTGRERGGSFKEGTATPGRDRGSPKNVKSEFEAKIPQGLDNYYRLLQMMDENPMRGSGRPNYVHLVYDTLVFPNMVIRGHFTEEGPSIVETADDPAATTYSITIQVNRTIPAFHRYKETIDAYQGILSMAEMAATPSVVQSGGGSPPKPVAQSPVADVDDLPLEAEVVEVATGVIEAQQAAKDARADDREAKQQADDDVAAAKQAVVDAAPQPDIEAAQEKAEESQQAAADAQVAAEKAQALADAQGSKPILTDEQAKVFKGAQTKPKYLCKKSNSYVDNPLKTKPFTKKETDAWFE